MKSPFYPPADRTSQWFSKLTSASRTSNRLVLWHSTEMGVPGEPWPTYTYNGLVGGSAPHFTVKPDRANRKLLWRQHWRADESARALAHPTGTPETNNSGVLQIELGGTSVEGDPGYQWWDPDDWALRDLHAFSVWARNEWGIPMIDQGRRWVHNKRVGSYVIQQGAPSRLSWDQWAAARGHCGHEHAPGNDHVDPGALPASRMLTLEEDMPLDATDKAWITAQLDALDNTVWNFGIGRSGLNAAQVIQNTMNMVSALPTAAVIAAAVKVVLTEETPAIAAAVAAALPVGTPGGLTAEDVKAVVVEVLGSTVARLTQG